MEFDEVHMYDEDDDEDDAYDHQYKGSGNKVGDSSQMEFVSQNGSIVLTNLTPDADGIVSIDLSKFNIMNNYQYYVRVIAYDQDQRIRKDYYLEDDKKEEIGFNHYIDDRMNVGLDPEYNYIETMDTILMQKGDKYDIMDYKGSEIATFFSFQQLFDLYLTISKNKELSEWIWLKTWITMTMEQKMKKYEKYFSHELHFFSDEKR